jgi:transposase InsO family protein
MASQIATGDRVHSDREAQFTSWLFGNRLREAGLIGLMGKVACAYDNSLIETSFGSMQIDLLDRRDWSTRAELAKRNPRVDRSVLQTRRGVTHGSDTSARSSSIHTATFR